MKDYIIAGIFLSGFFTVVFSALWVWTLRDPKSNWRTYKLREYATFALFGAIALCISAAIWMELAE
jgi:hypothetical protein